MITSHYVRHSWGPMEVSIKQRPGEEEDSEFWDPYNDDEYDSIDEDIGPNGDDGYPEDYFSPGTDGGVLNFS